jgi:hypothetical protein
MMLIIQGWGREDIGQMIHSFHEIGGTSSENLLYHIVTRVSNILYAWKMHIYSHQEIPIGGNSQIKCLFIPQCIKFDLKNRSIWFKHRQFYLSIKKQIRKNQIKAVNVSLVSVSIRKLQPVWPLNYFGISKIKMASVWNSEISNYLNVCLL